MWDEVCVGGGLSSFKQQSGGHPDLSGNFVPTEKVQFWDPEDQETFPQNGRLEYGCWSLKRMASWGGKPSPFPRQEVPSFRKVNTTARIQPIHVDIRQIKLGTSYLQWNILMKSHDEKFLIKWIKLSFCFIFLLQVKNWG